jgi:DNA-binding protein Fis
MKNSDSEKNEQTYSLYNLLKKEIKKMIEGIGNKKKGNIHPLIMNEIEKYIIEVVLTETNFNYVNATKLLGISRSTLYRRIEALEINKPLNNS